MHPDKKVGLALGILLIGIVGALFFRNEAPESDQNGPALANPQALDSRIRHKPNAPYLQDAAKPKDSVPSIPDALVPDVAPQIPGAVASTGNRQTSTVPEPIRPNARREGDHSTSVPTLGREVAGFDGGVPQPRGEKTERTVAASNAPQSHEVAAGESLSSIAFKYLGTHKRYMEIYEANKDVLRSPNDLSVGMKLKIPPKERSASAPVSTSAAATTEPPQTPSVGTPTVSASAGSSSTTSTSSSAPASVPLPDSKSDEPASAKPLFVRPKSIPARVPTKNGRSLTQTVPPDVPSVDGVEVKRDPAVIASKPDELDAASSEKTKAN